MKFTEALGEMIYNKKRVIRRCWNRDFGGYKLNWLEFNGKDFISGCGKYDMSVNLDYLIVTDDWEIIEKEKKPSERIFIRDENTKISMIEWNEIGVILDEMYEDIKKLKEK